MRNAKRLRLTQEFWSLLLRSACCIYALYLLSFAFCFEYSAFCLLPSAFRVLRFAFGLQPLLSFGANLNFFFNGFQ